MHEQSIVIALLEQVRRHTPDGATLRKVKVCVGAMRAIEPELMRWAWAAGTKDTAMEGAALELTIEPYQLTCPKCGRRWKSEALFERCSCGCDDATPGGDDALMLTAIEIDDMPPEVGPEVRPEVRDERSVFEERAAT